MGIFYTVERPTFPVIKSAIEDALKVSPSTLVNAADEAATRTVTLIEQTSPQFDAWRFGAAILIAIALLGAAIWTAQQQDLKDISKALMTAFSGFSGIVLGLLGGEAQKSST